MKEGDVVLAAIPQADRQSKHRPAIFLREMPAPFSDVLICGVSTQIHHRVEDFDEVLSTTDADFGSSGLLASSLIRLGFLTVLPRTSIVGAIGSISPERHRRLLERLGAYLIR